MSEAEKKRRLDYKQNRKKWIMIQVIILAVVAALALASAVTYYTLDETFYIDYTESGKIDYNVALLPNDFYEDDALDAGQAYVAALIDKITADFSYHLNMDAADVEYEYTYDVTARLVIQDAKGIVVYDPAFELVPKTTWKQSSNSALEIEEQVEIDYAHYNNMAVQFLGTYALENMSSALVVTFDVTVLGDCDAFATDSCNQYTNALSIPLTGKLVEMHTVAGGPAGQSKVLACENAINTTVFKVLAIVFGVLALLGGGFLLFFIFLTRNEDINYNIKIKRMLSNYGSFIQRLQNDFDTEGYQTLWLTTFDEMLDLRDTLQAPILMKENEDQTRSVFMIPTHTKILYMYEVKVDNYDLIYADAEAEKAEATEAQ